MATTPEVVGRPIRWVVAVSVATLLVGSGRSLFDYGSLAARLDRQPTIERGRVGANEVLCFLSRAGRPQLRREIAPVLERADGVASEQAEGWAWVVRAADELPADARVYVNVPDLLVYFYGTSAWYPRRVDAGPRDAVIKDGETLLRNGVRWDPGDWTRLRGFGYTHLVTRDDRGPRLVDLRADPSGVGR